MATDKLKLYTQHSRTWQTNRYVYPVISRRSKGLSIGVNLNPDKVCNFDCIYCCVDRTVPADTTHVSLNILREELNHLLALGLSGQIFQQPPFDQTPPELRRLMDVAFSGDGEPTSFRQFGLVCRMVAEMLESHGGHGVKIVVITNATLLQRPAVAEALDFLDHHNGEIWAKLDAGTEAHYKRVVRSGTPMSRVLDNIAGAGRKRPVVIQSLFINIDGQPADDAEIDAYIQRLNDLVAQGCQIKLVQVYTIARTTAEAYVTPLSDAAIDAIANRIRKTGLNVNAFYGP
ncbi:MAG: radical SAM protein [Phycisphaerales bacterium]|jgi:wyosine [tRNA(Phe)-imidazoG37] synthetase (radical SAM superfamily)|nr:radical SAM protein [Phycisphaerales bacterium]